MLGYRNAVYNPRDKTVDIFTWSDCGERITWTVPYQPYVYVEDSKGDETSAFNTKLRKKTFNTLYDKNKWIKDTGNRRLYENFNAVQQALLDTYWQHNEEEDFSKFPLKIYYLDIEAVAESFPNPVEAQHEINVITIFDNLSKTFHSWGLQPYNNKDPQVKYVHCKSEKELLYKFIDFFKHDPCDILSGWNSAGFDVPYIINRIRNVLGEDDVNRLSPGGRVLSRTFMNDFGKEVQTYRIDGISCVDYLEIYKKFIFSNKESYKLDYIAEIELGEKKVDYGDMSLYDLMQNDWDTFIDYNIQDVRLLAKLEDKLQFNNLLRMLAYVGLTTFESALGTVSLVSGCASKFARQRGQHIFTFVRDDDGKQNPGAFVADPIQGFHESLMSVDANSLYPSTDVSLNMSPETKLGKIIESDDDLIHIRHVNGQMFKLTKEKFYKFIKDENIAVSRAKVLFSQKTKGIFPEIMDYYYNKRKDVQKELKNCKSRIAEGDSSIELKQRAANLHAKQMCIKIFINSIYGTFGNKHSPTGDDDIAASITLTGQAVIKKARDIAKKFISNESGITDEKILQTVLVAGDTDSIYLSLKLLPMTFAKDGKITDEAYDYANRLEEVLNREITEWAKKSLNSADPRFIFKRESLIDKALFFEKKKRYVAHILDDEGIKCNKWKYVGIDIVRTTMPKAIKEYAKRIVETMVDTHSITETNNYVKEAYNVFTELPLEDISRVSGISKLEQWSAQCKEFKTVKRMPNHVKGAHFYNTLIDRMGLQDKYEKIVSGDKIKVFAVQMPNKYGIDCMGFKGKFPEEFKDTVIPNREALFDKIIYSLVERLYAAVNWQPRKPTQQVRNELLDLFSE